MKKIYKKYPNRRIYDTDASSYVTLIEVEEAIREGNEVQVVDVKRNEDVTALILTQIIMERAKKNQSLIPVKLLHLFIQAGETVMTEFFDNYFEKSLENFLAYRKQMEEQFKLYMALGMDFSSKTRQVIDKINSFQLS